MTDQISEGAHILDTKCKKNIKYQLLSVFGKDMKVGLLSSVLYSGHSDPQQPSVAFSSLLKGSWAVKALLKVTAWALGVLSNPAVRPQGEA